MKQKLGLRRRGGVGERFNRLMHDLLTGDLRRNSFRLWEADILLDLMSCDATGPPMREELRRYQKAMQRQMANGRRLPLKFSEYLDSLQARRTHRKAAEGKHLGEVGMRPLSAG